MSTALLELTLTLKKTDYIIITVILRCPRIIVLGHLKNEITAAIMSENNLSSSRTLGTEYLTGAC